MKNNIDKYLKRETGASNNFLNYLTSRIATKEDITNISKYRSQHCLGLVLSEARVLYLALNKSYIFPHDKKKDKIEFTQWWLDFIKDAVCEKFSAKIVDSDSAYIYMELEVNHTRVSRFANYELIRYLAGHSYNYIPGLIYEIESKFGKLFNSKLELLNFAYFLFVLTTNTPPTNFSWHYCSGINLFNVPFNISPRNYDKELGVYATLSTQPEFKVQCANINRLNEEIKKSDLLGKGIQYITDLKNSITDPIKNFKFSTDSFYLEKVLKMYRTILHDDKVTYKLLIDIIKEQKSEVTPVATENPSIPELKRIKRKYVRKVHAEKA